jgi:hypothetical protein
MQRSGGIKLPAAPQKLTVRVVCALPVEPFVSQAAAKFNAEKHELEGTPSLSRYVPMDGLVAWGRYERGEMGPRLPTV